MNTIKKRAGLAATFLTAAAMAFSPLGAAPAQAGNNDDAALGAIIGLGIGIIIGKEMERNDRRYHAPRHYEPPRRYHQPRHYQPHQHNRGHHRLQRQFTDYCHSHNGRRFCGWDYHNSNRPAPRYFNGRRLD